MALPLAAGLAIATGASSLIDNFINRKGTKNQNAADRQFQEEMWNKTNAYNSPEQQMARLKAAGLNPNLVYGNGATTTAQNITPMASKPLPAMNTGEVLSGAITQSQDFGIKDQQKDLLAIQAFATAKQAGLTEQKIETETFKTNNEGQKFVKGARENKMGEEMYNVTRDGMQAALTRLNLSNAEAEIKNANLPEQIANQIRQQYANLTLIKSQGTTQQLEAALKKVELQMNKAGIQKTDNIFLRMFSEFFPKKGDLLKMAKDQIIKPLTDKIK
ncbi:MAG: DNA pilot protein [Microviridae sp.]|nr:MAG: DNA pilot protein [Microviridae sp.]